MAYYYKINEDGSATMPPSEGIVVYEEKADFSGPCIKYDFSKHVLIELLDNVTAEDKLWAELGLSDSKSVIHKRLIIDPHRVNCRRAVVVCSSSNEAKELTLRLSQAKIMKRTICAVVIQELLSDICLFEKQIIQYGDKRSQHQLVYVTELSRCREVSGLAQYLREKFSPFGTILSVLVSEDKDGFAHPEGVIKFAHLSEAFAAELAYDQCAVALERLSVTTHHNILLSQCDLRARLREAYSRQSSEFSFNVSPESHIKDKTVKEADLDKTERLPSNNSKASVKEFELNESNGSINVNNEFPSDSAELADVLKKPCESNLVDCLQGIATFSESSLSRRASSCAETEPASTDPSDLPLSKNDSFSPPLNKTWSSRIMGWITDLPTVPPTSNDVGIMTDDMPYKKNVSTAKNKVKYDQLTQTNPADVVSNSDSFVTCKNGDVNSSFNSIASSAENLSNSNNGTIIESRALSDTLECPPCESSDEETLDTNCSSVWESRALVSNGSSVLSLKRKNSSASTQKLSLKNKKVSNPISEALDSETTVNLPSTKSCSVVLNSVPELDDFAKNLPLEQIPVDLLGKLSMSRPNSESLKINDPNMHDNYENQVKSKKYSKKENGFSSSSVKSQPTRRSSRLCTRDSDKKYKSFSDSSFKNGMKPIGQKEKLNVESPLRVWLKKELDTSTNNQVTINKESTKSIMCATANKDILISVGCSHMTCDVCYPDSTKLLLGFR